MFELVVIYLGRVMKQGHAGQVTDVDVQNRTPGVIQRARFILSCIYLLKMYLYQNQDMFLSLTTRIFKMS